MGQSRNKIGVEFEKSICESKGWVHSPKSPRIVWNGVGNSNFHKIISLNFDINKFFPLNTSLLEKYDAITDKGEKVEIKKYNSNKIRNWTSYSEPIFKIASTESLNTVINLFGEGDLDMAREKYNDFVYNISKTIGNDILDGITKSNIGIQLMDSFIPQSELEYRWMIKKSWKGFNRLSIEFRVKD